MLLLLAWCAALQSAGGATELLHRFESPHPYQLFGAAVGGAGDVNADGFDDVVAGAPWADPGHADAGMAFVFSGADGEILHRFQGNRGWIGFGRPVGAAGDVDADGFDDVLVGVPDARFPGLGTPGAAFVYSGRTGALLIRSVGDYDSERHGWAVAGIGDADGDGHDDVLIGAPSAMPTPYLHYGAAYLVSGATGSVLRLHRGAQNGDLFGNAVAAAGDADGDGFADYLIAAPHEDAGGIENSGRIYLHSGADGRLLQSLSGSSWYEALGAIAGAGDVDGDGRDDFLVGSSRWGGPGIGYGKAWLHSGATGAVLREYVGHPDWQRVGERVLGPGDVDGDDTPDLAIQAMVRSDAGFWYFTLTIFSGATGLESYRFGAEEMLEALSAQGIAGDVDADGTGDFVIGNVADPVHGLQGGSVTVIGVNPFLRASPPALSIAAGGSVALELEFPADFAGGTYVVLASAGGAGPSRLRGVAVPLAKDRLFWRGLLRGYGPRASGFAGTLDAAARASARLDVAVGLVPPGLAGTTLHFAAIATDAARGNSLASIAQRLTLLP